MNKRKVLSILLLALITVALAVSCSSNIETPVTNTEEVAYVTFGNGHSRELGASYLTKDYNSLFWFYTAIKDDQYGMTGVKTDKTPVRTSEQGHLPGLDGQVGPLSQGKWIFTLFAYETSDSSPSGNLVYQSEPVSVILKGGDVKNVPVSVSLKGESGKVSISDVKFKWANGGGSDSPKASLHFVGNNSDNNFEYIADTLTYVGGDDAYFMLSVADIPFADGTNNIPADYYTVTAKVYLPNYEDTPLATQIFGLRVYGNAITVITGNLIEGLFAEVIFDVAKQDMKVFVPSPTVATTISGITAVPDNTEVDDVTKSTTVVFDAGALNAVGANELQLDVKVTTVEAANNKFNISGTTGENKSAFAGINLTLTDSTGTNVVSDFAEDKYATVTTYIAKGLSNVVIKYNGKDGKSDPIATDDDNAEYKNVAAELTSDSSETDLGYNKATGLLRFKTNHFSEYYVLADCKAVNITTNVGYKDLQSALEGAIENQTIILTKSISVTDQIVINKPITLDLNTYTLTSQKPFVDESGNKRFAIVVNANSTIKNGTIISEYSRSIYGGANLSLLNVNVTTKGTGNAGVNVGSYSGNLYIDGGTYTGDYSIASFGANHTVTIKNVIANGVVYHNGSHKDLNMVIDNSTINGSNTDDSCGVYISGSKAHGTLHNVTINNSTISGSTAIEVKFANLTLNNCTVNATGELNYEKNNNGSTSSGFAVISADNSMNNENASLNGTITINGGNYAGQISLSTSGLATTDPEASYVITGGTFTDLVSAVEYATNGATIKLADDLVIPSTLNVNKSITIDGDNHTITSGAYLENGALINVSGTNNNITISNLNMNYTSGCENWYGIKFQCTGGKIVIDRVNIDAHERALFFSGCKDTEIEIKESTLVGIYPFNVNGGSIKSMTIDNSTLNGWTSFSTAQNTYVFTNCQFGKGHGYATVKPYGNTNFKGCTFSADYFKSLEGGIATGTNTPITINFDNCYMVTSDGETNKLTIDLLKTAFNYDITSGSSSGSSTINDQYWYVNGEKIAFNTEQQM